MKKNNCDRRWYSQTYVDLCLSVGSISGRLCYGTNLTGAEFYRTDGSGVASGDPGAGGPGTYGVRATSESGVDYVVVYCRVCRGSTCTDQLNARVPIYGSRAALAPADKKKSVE